MCACGCRFSSGIELASYVTSSEVLLRKPWDVIMSRCAGTITTEGEGISCKVFREAGSDLTIIAFEVTQDSSKFQVWIWFHLRLSGRRIFITLIFCPPRMLQISLLTALHKYLWSLIVRAYIMFINCLKLISIGSPNNL